MREPRVLTTTEFKALVAKLANPYRAMVLVGGCLGLRVSEIMGLQWADVDWDHLQVFVRRSVVAGHVAGTKTVASGKPVPLDPELATALIAWRDAAKFTAPTDFLFPGETGAPRWQGMILKQHIQPAAIAAEISGNVGWHTFRHSYRAWLKRAGVAVEVQKELMRHSNINPRWRFTASGGCDPGESRGELGRRENAHGELNGTSHHLAKFGDSGKWW